MASSLPFPLRVAAGVVAEALESVKRFPTELATLPVTVAGRAAKLSFQLNQQLTDLAVAGDRLLARVGPGEEPPERTAWSTIDEPDEVARNDPQAAPRWDSAADAEADAETDTDTDTEKSTPFAAPRARRPAPPRGGAGTKGAAAAKGGAAAKAGAGARSARSTAEDPMAGTDGQSRSADADTETVSRQFDTAGGELDGAASDDPLPHRAPDRRLLDQVEILEGDRQPQATLPRSDSGELTLAQMRVRVRAMSVDEVRRALEAEESGRARPAFLTLLTNRLSTLARTGE